MASGRRGLSVMKDAPAMGALVEECARKVIAFIRSLPVAISDLK